MVLGRLEYAEKIVEHDGGGAGDSVLCVLLCSPFPTNLLLLFQASCVANSKTAFLAIILKGGLCSCRSLSLSLHVRVCDWLSFVPVHLKTLFIESG